MSLHYADAMRTWGSDESALNSSRVPPERFHSQASLRSDPFGAVVPVLDASRPTGSPSQSQQIMGEDLFMSFGGRPSTSSREIHGGMPDGGRPSTSFWSTEIHGGMPDGGRPSTSFWSREIHGGMPDGGRPSTSFWSSEIHGGMPDGGRPSTSFWSREIHGIPEENFPEGPRLSRIDSAGPELERVPSAQYFGAGPPTDPRLTAPGSVQRMSSVGSQGGLHSGLLHSDRIVVDAGRPPDMQGSPPLGYRMDPPTSERGLVDAASGAGLDPFMRQSASVQHSASVAALPNSTGSLPTPPMTSTGYPTYGAPGTTQLNEQFQTREYAGTDLLQHDSLVPGVGMGMHATPFATPPWSPETAAVLDAGGETAGCAHVPLQPGYANDPLQDSVWSFTNEVQDRSADTSGLNAELMASAGFDKAPMQETGNLPEKPQRRPPLYQASFSDVELEVAQLEGTVLKQHESHLQNQLSILERIAQNIVTNDHALEDWDPEEEPAWRAGTREWQSKYTSEPLNGFWIDKARIAAREEHLWKLRKHSQENSLFDLLAGVPVDKKKTRYASIEKMTWRGLGQFDEVDDDDFAYINREPGGDCAGRPVRPQTAEVLTF